MLYMEIKNIFNLFAFNMLLTSYLLLDNRNYIHVDPLKKHVIVVNDNNYKN